MSIVRSIRAILRLVAWVVLTLGGACTWFIGALPAWLCGAQRKWRWICFGGWARACLWVSGVRIEMRGRWPRDAVFLVANHQSWLDIPVLAACFDLVFISMAELANWPLIGWMARAFGTILIDRSDKRSIPAVNAAIARSLQRGECVAFFPEGRIHGGHEPGRFKAALFEVAAGAQHPVACVALSYATGPGDDPVEESVVWGARPFLSQAWRLVRQGRIRVLVQVADSTVQGSDRKQLAQACELRVRAQLAPEKDTPEKLEGAVAGAFEG